MSEDPDNLEHLMEIFVSQKQFGNYAVLVEKRIGSVEKTMAESVVGIQKGIKDNRWILLGTLVVLAVNILLIIIKG